MRTVLAIALAAGTVLFLAFSHDATAQEPGGTRHKVVDTLLDPDRDHDIKDWEYVKLMPGFRSAPNNQCKTRVRIVDGEGVAERPVNAVPAYPNPTTDFLNIPLPTDLSYGIRLRITDLKGRVCADCRIPVEDGIVRVDVRKLPPGPYLYRVGVKGKPDVTGSFVKE